jgi:hypothetical protein
MDIGTLPLEFGQKMPAWSMGEPVRVLIFLLETPFYERVVEEFVTLDPP